VFYNTDLVPSANVPGTTEKLQQQIFDAVMSFARTGDPNHAELPNWPATIPGDEATMIFDRTCRVGHNFDHELQKIHRAATKTRPLISDDGPMQH